MKKNLFASLVVIAFSLTSCQNIKNKNAIFVMNTNAETVNEITINELINMNNSKMTYPVLFYTEGCVSCTAAHSILDTYVKEKHVAIKGLEVDRNILKTLSNQYPTIFSDNTTFPRMMTLSKGEVTYSFKQANMVKHSSFYSELNLMLKKSNITDITYDKNISIPEDGLTFVYDNNIPSSGNFFTDFIYENAVKSSKNTYFLDFNKCDSSLLESLNLTEEDHLKVIKNGVTMDYSSLSNSVIEFINSYYAI